MSTTRRPLGTGPRTDHEQSRTDERRTTVERAAAGPRSPVQPPAGPARSGRRPLGTGPEAAGDH
ncbi:hypothetical protein [Streptomyces sp. NBC_00648]|uniref:hypothetical protein n=1 Tax=Streptomyces sp. NBC_00648 TaxID=2975797 RepID=UPI003254C137